MLPEGDLQAVFHCQTRQKAAGPRRTPSENLFLAGFVSSICASLRWRAHCRLARQAILLSGSKGRSELSRGSGFLNRSFSHLVLASKTTHSSRSLTSQYAVCVVPPGTPAQVRSSKESGEGHNVRRWMKNEPCRCSRARKEKTFYGKYGDERSDSTNQLSELRARGEGSVHAP